MELWRSVGAVGALLLGALAVRAGAQEAIPRQVLLPAELRAWEFPASNPGRFSLVVFVDVGARDEVRGKTGISHLLEHVVFRSTKQRDTEALLSGLRHHGVQHNAFTTVDSTAYFFDASVETWPWLVATVGEMIATPALRPEDVRSEVAIVLEELSGRGMDIATRSGEDELYPNHPLGASAGGTARDVGALDAEDVAAYHARHYRTGAIVVAWAGGAPRDDCNAAIAQAFAALPPGHADVARTPPRPRTGSWVPAGLAPAPGGPGHVMAGYHVAQRNGETLAAMLVLTEDLGDECFRTMRTERPLAYFTATHFVTHADAWRVEFIGQVKQRSSLKDLVTALDAAYERALKMSDADFDSARNAVLSGLTVDDGPELLAAVETAWPARVAGAADVDLAGALRNLTRARALAIGRGTFRKDNRYLISDDPSLADTPVGGLIVLGAIAAVALAYFLSRALVHRARRLRVAVHGVALDARARFSSKAERDDIDEELNRFLRRPPPGDEDS